MSPKCLIIDQPCHSNYRDNCNVHLNDSVRYNMRQYKNPEERAKEIAFHNWTILAPTCMWRFENGGCPFPDLPPVNKTIVETKDRGPKVPVQTVSMLRVMEDLGVSEQWLMQAAKEGKIPKYHLCSDGWSAYTEGDVEAIRRVLLEAPAGV